MTDHHAMNESDESGSDAAGTTRLSSLPVRSFVRREGRLTRGQQRALADLWPAFGVDYSEQLLDLDALFERAAQRVLEIGFGNGESLAQSAAASPDSDFIGIEVHRPGVGHLLQLIEQHHLTNVRVMCHDAIEILSHQVPQASLNAVALFFPDPWPKKRHHKRRIVQPAFLALVASRLRAGGRLHIATDWENYAEHIFETVRASPSFENLAQGADFQTGCVPRPASRPHTKFEMRGKRLGHGVWDFVYSRR